MRSDLEILKLSGKEAKAYVDELAALRLKVFFEFPYLYEGSLEYEKNYLETYFKAQHSFILMVKDKSKLVGVTTGIWAAEEEESFKRPFVENDFDPSEVFYFGESVLLKEYRGQGLGKLFFKERENYARSLGFISLLSFCAVVREQTHPLKPTGYLPLNMFWEAQGFSQASGVTTEYAWPDRNESESTKKLMQYWIKKIERNS